MLIKTAALTAVGLGLTLATYSPAQALTSKECSAKYQAAKSAGTLNGLKYQDFRKAQCSDPAATAPAATDGNPLKANAAPAAAKPASSSAAVFPKGIDPKYAKEPAAKARMHTCLDQYNANKAASGNGGLNWIQKGGGYYSQCNKQLKGA